MRRWQSLTSLYFLDLTPVLDVTLAEVLQTPRMDFFLLMQHLKPGDQGIPQYHGTQNKWEQTLQ